ncbi:hypothetical protein CJU94_10145 [Paraburkholderia aromaticivorans]|uniref:Adhesin n=2 Tax=Paraburkholderia aromaticivorans TaxID=2026199 RepID=A0A248VMV3_9BURK|nr:hypothetical protein CJU94_10145 [Paraburkholderia aromaticivorans]
MSPLKLHSLHAALCVCIGGAALVASHAHAQSVPTLGATSTIANGAAAGVTGAFAVNEAAGLNNAQANQITVSNGGAADNGNASVQSAAVAAKVTSARASIEANAFSNSSGAVLVNQSAGAGNLQRNSTQLGTAALGVETVSDGELSATAPKNGGLGQSIGVRGVREANISSDAFKNVNGIVQINQTAGAGNATANSFVLRPPAGTFFN